MVNRAIIELKIKDNNWIVLYGEHKAVRSQCVSTVS